MTEGLPEGLVVTTGKVRSGFESLSGVEVEDIAQLWRVYTTNSSFLQDQVGRRLENFFWRIWGSRRIYGALSGPTLATLFVQISEGGPIRTTPTSSPRKTLSFTESQQVSPRGSTLQSISHDNSGSSDSKESQICHAQSRGPLPPILKKSNAAQAEAPKTARIQVADPTDQSIMRTSSRPQTEVSVAQGPSGDHAPKKGRKKMMAFVASTASSKRRPVIVRHKSSQPSSSTASAKNSPPTAHQLKRTSTQVEFPKVDFNPPRPVLSGAGESWQDVSSMPSGKIPTTSSSSTATKTSPPPTGFTSSSVHHHKSPRNLSPDQRQQSSENLLVDRDFRLRFAEKRLQESLAASSPATASLLSPDQQEQGPEEESTRARRSLSPSSGHLSVPSGGDEDQDQTQGRDKSPRDRSAVRGDHNDNLLRADLPYRTRFQPSSVSPLHSRSVSPSQPRSQLSLMIEQSRLSSSAFAPRSEGLGGGQEQRKDKKGGDEA